MKRLYLQLAVLLIFLANVLSTILIFHYAGQAASVPTAKVAGSAQGVVRFCINRPPTLVVPCSPNMTQDVPYSCQLIASDPDNAGLSYLQNPKDPNMSTWFNPAHGRRENVTLPIFNISSSGLISFTPRNEQRGNHSTLIFVTDGSLCDNNWASVLFNFSIANVNDPPYLYRPLPNQKFSVNTTLFGFYLNDYFLDPDEDPLSYTALQSLSQIGLNISIEPDSRVTISSSQCGKALFKFIAKDPSNAEGESNIVQIESECPQPVQESKNSTGKNSGGGGSGGASNTCRPELVCLPWSECYPNGMQVQVCKDKNGCDQEETRFYRNCTFVEEKPLCRENWLCTDWSMCSMDGVQNRTCTDLTQCGSNRFRPELEQQCTYIPTCHDGVKNGDETDIDCGGSCAACRLIQQPEILPVSRFPTLLWLLAIVLLGSLLALFVLYRERVYEGLAELGWLLARRRRKADLLDASEKRLLLDELFLLERDQKTLEARKAYERLGMAVRKYYSFILDLPYEFTPEEYVTTLQQLELPEDVRYLVSTYASRLGLLESGKLSEFNPLLFSSVLEELRLLVCMTSEYTILEIQRDLRERKIDEKLSFSEEIRLRLLNAFEALEFQHLDLAKAEYLKILRAYDNLGENAKAAFYTDIHRLFLEIGYVIETTE